MEDLDSRLADQVTTLSTKLVTEVAKSSHLEEAVVQMRKENGRLRHALEQQHAAAGQLEAMAAQNAALRREHDAQAQARAAAEAKNKQLEGEVEDLTASLFSEANEMVSTAAREAYNFKLKNRKLIEELAEKDAIIDNLQQQLCDLKQLIVKVEGERHAHTPQPDAGAFDSPRPQTPSAPAAHDGYAAQLQHVLYGPRARSVRFDLPGYQNDFKGFVYQLVKPDFVFDLASLKTLKYFRRIWAEEIEPSFAHVPAISGQTFMNRWSKGKSFWNILVEGKAVIEPVAGVNETFRLTYKGAKSGLEVPVAVSDPCAFCGECRNDLLEHARLYNLKLYMPTAEAGDAVDGPHEILGTFPLSNFCLVKLRAICDFFAKLRLIHANIHKLKQNASYDDAAYASSFQFKRSTDTLQKPASSPDDEPILIKLHLMLLVLRAKIFWSKIGFWDTDEEIECTKIDDIPLEVFRGIVSENVAFRSGELLPTDSPSEPVRLAEKSGEQEQEAPGTEAVAQEKKDDGATKAAQPGEHDDSEKDDSEFEDSSEVFDQPALSRSTSKSKAFKEKMDSDLNSTLQMLQENLE